MRNFYKIRGGYTLAFLLISLGIALHSVNLISTALSNAQSEKIIKEVVAVVYKTKL